MDSRQAGRRVGWAAGQAEEAGQEARLSVTAPLPTLPAKRGGELGGLPAKRGGELGGLRAKQKKPAKKRG